jgi:2-hydroxychromene-2-carboxylate isomerase
MAELHDPPLVEFLFSPGSRYSYLAASQIGSIESETGCRVDWRPVNGPDLRALRGRDPFAGEPVSGQYDWTYRRRDAEAWADYYGIRFREPPTHTFDFRLLARAATAARRMGAAAAYGWRLCSAVYGSDVWPIDENACVRVAAEVGLPVEQFAILLADPGTDELLATAARDAHARGAFGVPTFFIGDEMFWGNDRIAILKHVLLNRNLRRR